MVFRHPYKNLSKMITDVYIHQKMDHKSHIKIQEMEDLGIFQETPKRIPKLTCPFPL